MDEFKWPPASEPATESALETQITESYESLASPTPRLAVLTVLAHPDASRVGEKVLLPELSGGGEIELGRVAPTFVAKLSRQVRPLDDVHLSRKPIRLLGNAGGGVSFHRADSAMPVKVEGERLQESLRFPQQALESGVRILLGRRVALLLHLDVAGFEESKDFEMVGESFEIRRLREEIRIAARLDVPVLIRGESGTGKELVARAIHGASERSTKPYLAVNIAAVPHTLAAAELFGAAKGAYTGAETRKQGFFQRAAGGTLFLDEIGETPDAVQPLLLRALESGEVQIVGSAKPLRFDVRLVAATDADLEDKIAAGEFRMPLLHRLAGFVIHVPPLRARGGDFGRLLFHFLRLELKRLGAMWPSGGEGRPWPAAGLVARLAGFDWPGNVRQLRNVARRLAISHVTGSELRLDFDLLGAPPESVPAERHSDRPKSELDEAKVDSDSGDAAPSSAAPPAGWRPAYRKPSEVTEEELLTTLRRHHYELKASAAALGMSRASLYLMVRENPRIRKASELEADEILEAFAAAGGDLEAAQILEVSVYALRRRAKALRLDIGPADKI